MSDNLNCNPAIRPEADADALQHAAREKLAGTGLELTQTAGGLALTNGKLKLLPSFADSLPRLRKNNLEREFLVKAARMKGVEHPTALDATAGLGQDSILLAAAGFEVDLYEKDPVIAVLLYDELKRAEDIPELKDIVTRMHLHPEDSIEAMNRTAAAGKTGGTAAAGESAVRQNAVSGGAMEYMVPQTPDVIVLDPMFPERRKSALVGKKFQLLHFLEQPCPDENALLNAALAVKPKKIVIKRPLKGPHLAGVKPDYSLSGKAIRYDCILPAGRKDLPSF